MNELSIIIPCTVYTDGLSKLIDDLTIYLLGNPSDVDLIIVSSENDSYEKTFEYIKTKYPWLKVQFLQRYGAHGNFGALVRFGMAYSISKYVVVISPFGDDDISVINQMLTKARAGAQIVQANRYADKETAKSVSLLFRFYQYVYRFMTWIILGKKINDSTYGFKIFDRIFIQSLGLTQNGYAVCPEIIFKGLLAKGKIEFVPTRQMITIYKSDFRMTKEGIGYLWLLVRAAVHRLGIRWF